MPDSRSAIANVLSPLNPGKRFMVLDAKLFEALWRVFDFIIAPQYKWTTNSNHEKNVIVEWSDISGDVEVRGFNGGGIDAAVATKP